MRMSCRFGAVVIVALALGHVAGAADLASKDPLAAAGLTKAGNAYVLADEAALLEGMKALRAKKVEADKETKARQLLDTRVAEKRKVAKDAEKLWEELEGKLSLVTKQDAKNRIILRMNRLLIDRKAAIDALKEMDEQSGKLSSTAKAGFVDDLFALKAKADPVAERYAALAGDAGVKAAITKAKAANAKAALGPSPEFATAVADLKKWSSEVESETIPMREEANTFKVDVLVNGEPLQMSVDTGASSIMLSGEVAERLKVSPGPEDPVVHMKLADGSIIEGQQITLKSVRVGRFTVEDAQAVVLRKGLPDAALLLGGSFLNRFIVKIDPSKHALQLTEIKKEGPAKPAATVTTRPATP